MATQEQVNANRRNAQKSTGPRTEEGKAKSRLNAVKHGVLSTNVVVSSCENRQEYDAMREQLFAEHQPVTVVEHALVDRLSRLLLREKRLAEAEASSITLNNSCSALEAEMGGVPPKRGLCFTEQNLIGRYQGSLNRQIRDTVRDLRDEQQRRIKNEAQATETLRDAPASAIPQIRQRDRAA